jgi:asparagine synthase (glutamine-hydrolysing)
LAIQDLTAEGHQPMHSADGRFVLVFNGEIYNFLDLKEQLERWGRAFRGHSDTEVMLAAFEKWGVEAAIERFVGMFAFAVWDRVENCLHLVRDRAGEKPLYYTWTRGVFLFGSELHALRTHPEWRGEVDQDALSLFMRYGYVPSPRSIYRDVFKLPPGCILSLYPRQFYARENPVPKRYWCLQSAAEKALARPFEGSAQEALEEFTVLLQRSVASQMVADVPVGAFLSGGVDSSTIVALMQTQSRRPIKTFSIGFNEKGYNEAPYAKMVARRLGTQHTELYVHASTLRDAIPRVTGIFDEPFGDSSHIPTLLLCELARKQVTVCLSGDAGDELFGGYYHYQRAQQVWNLSRRLPSSVRSRLARYLSNVATSGRAIQRSIGVRPGIVERVSRFSELFSAPEDEVLYQLLVSCCRKPHEWLSPGTNALPSHWPTSSRDALPTLLDRMMYSDFVRYLPDDVLVKVDRAAMAQSLETRIPLLDHRIIEFSWSLPRDLKQRRGQAKWLLRQVLYRYVPRRLVDRPKQGFGAPVGDWICSELRPWAEDLLATRSLREEGFFCERTVRQRWQEHLTGQRNWGGPLWNVLMFLSWRESQKMPLPVGDSNQPLHPKAQAPTELMTQ